MMERRYRRRRARRRRRRAVGPFPSARQRGPAGRMQPRAASWYCAVALCEVGGGVRLVPSCKEGGARGKTGDDREGKRREMQATNNQSILLQSLQTEGADPRYTSYIHKYTYRRHAARNLAFVPCKTRLQFQASSSSSSLPLLPRSTRPGFFTSRISSHHPHCYPCVSVSTTGICP